MCTVLKNNLLTPVIKRISFQEQLERVVRSADTVPDLMKFLESYFLHMSGGSLVLDMKRSLALSRTLRSSGSVRFDTVKLYLDFWRQKGFLK